MVLITYLKFQFLSLCNILWPDHSNKISLLAVFYLVCSDCPWSWVYVPISILGIQMKLFQSWLNLFPISYWLEIKFETWFFLNFGFSSTPISGRVGMKWAVIQNHFLYLAQVKRSKAAYNKTINLRLPKRNNWRVQNI